jgi:hypothetical protein
VGLQTDVFDANFMNATYFKTGTFGGRVSSMSVHVGSVDSTPNNQFQLAIYSDNSGKPGNLIANSSSGTLKANSWNSLAITASLKASTYYWLAYNTNASRYDRNNMNYINSTSLRSAWQNSSQSFGSWPSSFGSISRQGAIFSIYATFAPGLTFNPYTGSGITL